MVRAILDGTKIQTRRVIKPVICADMKYMGLITDSDTPENIGKHFWLYSDVLPNSMELIKCPYGKPGDRLWVRETFVDAGTNTYTKKQGIQTLFYAASLPIPKENIKQFKGKWKPSIHMPRWASRLTLEVTNIRVERVQDISDEDILSEGFKMDNPAIFSLGYRGAFKSLWDSINAARGHGWEANPWVWVVEFKKLEDK
jgi:hypothetical protein